MMYSLCTHEVFIMYPWCILYVSIMYSCWWSPTHARLQNGHFHIKTLLAGDHFWSQVENLIFRAPATARGPLHTRSSKMTILIYIFLMQNWFFDVLKMKKHKKTFIFVIKTHRERNDPGHFCSFSLGNIDFLRVKNGKTPKTIHFIAKNGHPPRVRQRSSWGETIIYTTGTLR